MQEIILGKCGERDSDCFEYVEACDLCGGSDFDPEMTVNQSHLVRCKDCQLVFTSPRFKEDYLEKMYATAYYEQANSYLSEQLKDPSKDLCRLAGIAMKWAVDPQREGKPRSLDVGCGGGAIVSAFQKMGWEAVGIDLSEKAVRAGRKQGLDLRTVGIADEALGTFNMITAFHVLEHIFSPRIFLECCADRLTDKGFLLLEVPDYESWRSRKMGAHWPCLYPDLDLYQFTSETLTRYLEKMDWKIQKIQRVNGRGPLECSNRDPAKNMIVGNRIKKTLFEFRHLFYWFPGGRPLLQYIIWQTFGYGEFIRILCQKIDRV